VLLVQFNKTPRSTSSYDSTGKRTVAYYILGINDSTMDVSVFVFSNNASSSAFMEAIMVSKNSPLLPDASMGKKALPITCFCCTGIS